MIPIVFADIEVALADHLTAEFSARGESAVVRNSVPNPRPDRFVRVVRVGGTQSNLITDRPRLICECWDIIGTGAAGLAGLVRALVSATAPGRIGDIWVDKVIDMGVAFLPDSATNTPRYLVTAELHVAGAVLA